MALKLRLPESATIFFSNFVALSEYIDFTLSNVKSKQKINPNFSGLLRKSDFYPSLIFDRFTNPIPIRRGIRDRLHTPTWFENCPTGLEKPHCNTVVKMVKPNLLVGISGVMVNESENYKLFLCYKLISKTKYEKENLCFLMIQIHSISK